MLNLESIWILQQAFGAIHGFKQVAIVAAGSNEKLPHRLYSTPNRLKLGRQSGIYVMTITSSSDNFVEPRTNRPEGICVNVSESSKLSDFVAARGKDLPQDARAMQGVYLFLVALSVFFFSSIILYVVYVVMRLSPHAGARAHSFHWPISFIPSTLLLIGVSGSLEWALKSAKKDKFTNVKRATIAALVLGMLFMIVQAEGMYRLIEAASDAATARTSAYALTFVLVVAHALHVLGGIVGLVASAFAAQRDRYDHERNVGLRFCTVYWHFLDVVWVFLMASFIATGYLVNR